MEPGDFARMARRLVAQRMGIIENRRRELMELRRVHDEGHRREIEIWRELLEIVVELDRLTERARRIG